MSEDNTALILTELRALRVSTEAGFREVRKEVSAIGTTVGGHTERLNSGQRRMETISEDVKNISTHLFEGNGHESISKRLGDVEATVQVHDDTLKHSRAAVGSVVGTFFIAAAALFREKLGF